MPDLKTLIRDCNVGGVSFREMERRSEEAGCKVKFQTFSELANQVPRSWPKHTGTIRGIAIAIGVAERAVVLAYAESLGLDIGRVGFADLVPLDADGMSTQMRDAVLSVIRAATEGTHHAEAQESWQEKGSTSEQSTPPIGAGEERDELVSRGISDGEADILIRNPVNIDDMSVARDTTKRRRGKG